MNDYDEYRFLKLKVREEESNLKSYIENTTNEQMCFDTQKMLSSNWYVPNKFTELIIDIWFWYHGNLMLTEKQRWCLAKHLQINGTKIKSKKPTNRTVSKIKGRFEGDGWGIDFLGNYYADDLFDRHQEVPNFGIVSESYEDDSFYYGSDH